GASHNPHDNTTVSIQSRSSDPTRESDPDSILPVYFNEWAKKGTPTNTGYVGAAPCACPKETQKTWHHLHRHSPFSQVRRSNGNTSVRRWLDLSTASTKHPANAWESPGKSHFANTHHKVTWQSFTSRLKTFQQCSRDWGYHKSRSISGSAYRYWKSTVLTFHSPQQARCQKRLLIGGQANTYLS